MHFSEAFYTPLQCVEVCLRNCIHEQLSNAYGSDWLLNGKPNLDAGSQDMIAAAIADSEGVGPPSPGAIVAEVKFAFWVGLLAPRYDATLWRTALYKAFIVGAGQRRSIVHGRMNAIRRFRNRVMHHEPIFHRPHKTMHDEILEAIGWMCKDTKSWVSHHSRYPAVAGSVVVPTPPAPKPYVSP